MEKQIKSFDGLTINYDIDKIKGKDKYIIFIHGAGADLNAWYRVRDILRKENIPTLAIDLRGHGKSTRPKSIKGYNFDYFARDIHDIIEKENIKDFTLIGYCFGGSILQVFHKNYPKDAKSYIFISSTYKSPRLLKTIATIPIFSRKSLDFILKGIDPNKKKFHHLDYSKYIGSGDWNYPRIFANIFHTSIKSWMFTYKEFSLHNGLDILKTITQKTLIMHGEKDSAVKVKRSYRIHKQIKNSKLKIFKGHDHIIILNHPELVTKEIIDFIKKK